MRKLILPALFVLSQGSAWAGSFGTQARGTTAAQFLELGVGGRAMGLGGAFTAVADDATALYWNPAGLTNVEKRAATFMHASYLQSSYYDYGAYAHKTELGSFGAGFQYLNAGKIARTDTNFTETGSVTPNDIALSFGYARAWQGGSAGASAKYIRSSIIHTAQAMAVDTGVLSPKLLDKKLTLGFALLNLGGALKYAETSESLPLTFKFGAALRPSQRWLLSMDVAAPRGDTAYASFGTEIVLSIGGGAWRLTPRTGYNTRTASSLGVLSGLAIGAGLGTQSLTFDYAFMPMGALGTTNRFSASLRF